MGNLHENMFIFVLLCAQKMHVFMYFLNLVPPLHHNKWSIVFYSVYVAVLSLIKVNAQSS